MLTSTLYRYIYSKSSISTYIALFIASKWLTHAYAEAHLLPLFGLATSGEDNATDYIILGGRDGTGKANALDFRLAASWACLRLPMPVLVCSYCYPARTVTRTGWFQFKLFVVSVTPVSVSFSLIKKCSRHYPFGKMLRIVFVLRGVLTLVSRLPHVVSAPITISVVLVGLVDVTIIIISLAAAAPELWFLNCFLSLYLLLN